MRSERRRHSGLALLPVAAVLLVVAYVIADARRPSADVTQRPTPSISAATVPAPLSPRYAVVSGSMTFTRESDGLPVGSVNARSGLFAVSPDGTRAAYFPEPGFDELWIAEVAHLDRAQRVLSIAPRFSGGVMWSTDSKGVLFSAQSRERVAAVEGEPLEATLEGFHLEGSRREPFASLANTSLRPLLWVREPKIVAAVTPLGQKGPGGYVAVSGGSARSWSLPDAARNDVVVGFPAASSDGRWIASLYQYGARSVLRVWPSDDLPRATELEAPGTPINSAFWRPRSLDLAVDVGGALELWTREGAKRRVTDLGGRSLAAFRWDGSAIYAGMLGEQPEIIEIDTGRRAPLPDLPVMGAVPSSIVASARLE